MNVTKQNLCYRLQGGNTYGTQQNVTFMNTEKYHVPLYMFYTPLVPHFTSNIKPASFYYLHIE